MSWDALIADVGKDRVVYSDDHVVLICADYRDVVEALPTVDAVIVDPPYSERTHDGHDDGATLANRAERSWPRANGATDRMRPRRELSYEHWTPADVETFCAAVVPKCDGWIVALSDSDLCAAWRTSFEAQGLTGFQPLPCVISGMTVRMCGDGPSSWAVYANVARPKSLAKWGTLRGAYVGKRVAADVVRIGGKPLWLMQELIADYSHEGDVLLDTCAGGGTLGRAAKDAGRRAILIEQDHEACEVAARRLRPHRSWQQPLDLEAT